MTSEPAGSREERGLSGLDRWAVVVVPFPFTDRVKAKRRPALVLSRAETFGSGSGHSVMAMITSAANAGWPLDAAIEGLSSAGLSAPSVVRMKLFTLDERFILRQIGRLGSADQERVGESLRLLLQGVGRQADAK